MFEHDEMNLVYESTTRHLLSKSFNKEGFENSVMIETPQINATSRVQSINLHSVAAETINICLLEDLFSNISYGE